MNTPTGLTTKRLMWVIWPGFLVAGVAELVFFSVFDPFDLHFFGAPLEMSSALTIFLERGPKASFNAAGDAGDGD